MGLCNAFFYCVGFGLVTLIPINTSTYGFQEKESEANKSEGMEQYEESSKLIKKLKNCPKENIKEFDHEGKKGKKYGVFINGLITDRHYICVKVDYFDYESPMHNDELIVVGVDMNSLSLKYSLKSVSDISKNGIFDFVVDKSFEKELSFQEFSTLYIYGKAHKKNYGFVDSNMVEKNSNKLDQEFYNKARYIINEK